MCKYVDVQIWRYANVQMSDYEDVNRLILEW